MAANQFVWLRDAETEAESRARVPAHFIPLHRVGPQETLAGACFVCIRRETLNDNNTDEKSLLKQVLIVKVPNGSVRDNNKSSEFYLRREIDTIRHFPRHPRFVQFFESSDPDDDSIEPYIAMEYISGMSLGECWLTNRNLLEHDVWHILSQLAEALLWLHHGWTPEDPDGNDRKLLPSTHGDIRGPNVMLNCWGYGGVGLVSTVIIDLGSAKIRPLNSAAPEPSRKAFLADVLAILKLFHAMAHNVDPTAPWDDPCLCDLTQPGLLFTDEEDLFFGLVGKHNIWLESSTHAERKDSLLELLQLTKDRMRGLNYRDVATDPALRRIRDRPVGAGPEVPVEKRFKPASAPEEPQVPPILTIATGLVVMYWFAVILQQQLTQTRAQLAAAQTQLAAAQRRPQRRRVGKRGADLMAGNAVQGPANKKVTRSRKEYDRS